MEKRNLIFIECGTTMASPIQTGIQRVVRNIIRQTDNVLNTLNSDYCFIKFENNHFLEINITDTPPLPATSPLKKFLKFFDLLAAKILPNRVYLYGLRMFLINCYKNSATKDLDNSIQHIISTRQQLHRNTTLRPILLLLDATWDSNIWTATQDFRNNGGYVCAVLFDLIPYTHPTTVKDGANIIYNQWLNKLPLNVDSIICISQSVREDFLCWQNENKPAITIAPDKVDYFHLGAELLQNDPVICIFNSAQPTYLVVGSIEPRKNHAYILDAFDLLWRKGSMANLAIVGGFGWKCDELIDRIKMHAEFGNKLFLIRDASDRDLVALYDKCEALIFASSTEGFGLPIVEAFQRGAQVICSDIPIFHEVAGDDATYFDLSNPSSLSNLIYESMSNSIPQTIKIAHTSNRWMTWNQSTQQLFAKLLFLLSNK